VINVNTSHQTLYIGFGPQEVDWPVAAVSAATLHRPPSSVVASAAAWRSPASADSVEQWSVSAGAHVVSPPPAPSGGAHSPGAETAPVLPSPAAARHAATSRSQFLCFSGFFINQH